MFKIAVDILHEHHLAEDALQEAFVRKLPRNVI